MTTSFELEAREAKCLRLSLFLHEKGFGSDFVARFADEDWWRSAARMAGVHPPSELSVARTIELLKERESGAFDAAFDSTEPSEEAPAATSGSQAAPSPTASKGQVESPPAATPSEAASVETPPTGVTPNPVGQASIFDPPYQAHSETSREAARAIRPTRGKSHRRILDLLAEKGPLTDEQMQDLLQMNPSTQRPRRRELARAGTLEVVGTDTTKAGRTAVTWGIRAEAEKRVSA